MCTCNYGYLQYLMNMYISIREYRALIQYKDDILPV